MVKNELKYKMPTYIFNELIEEIKLPYKTGSKNQLIDLLLKKYSANEVKNLILKKYEKENLLNNKKKFLTALDRISPNKENKKESVQDFFKKRDKKLKKEAIYKKNRESKAYYKRRNARKRILKDLETDELSIIDLAYEYSSITGAHIDEIDEEEQEVVINNKRKHKEDLLDYFL